MAFDPVIPDQWSAALNATAPGVTDLIDSGSTDWVSALERLLPAALLADQQRRILGVQLERARAGLPPIDAGAYGAGVRVGLDNRTSAMAGVAGVAVVALIALALLRSR